MKLPVRVEISEQTRAELRSTTRVVVETQLTAARMVAFGLVVLGVALIFVGTRLHRADGVRAR